MDRLVIGLRLMNQRMTLVMLAFSLIWVDCNDVGIGPRFVLLSNNDDIMTILSMNVLVRWDQSSFA